MSGLNPVTAGHAGAILVLTWMILNCASMFQRASSAALGPSVPQHAASPSCLSYLNPSHWIAPRLRLEPLPVCSPSHAIPCLVVQPLQI